MRLFYGLCSARQNYQQRRVSSGEDFALGECGASKYTSNDAGNSNICEASMLASSTVQRSSVVPEASQRPERGRPRGAEQLRAASTSKGVPQREFDESALISRGDAELDTGVVNRSFPQCGVR